MRTAFIETLCKLAEEDEKIWLLCADLGFSVVEPFMEAFPGRFVNVGVAEQNMTGLAAGLAMTGKTVFTYSIANFPVMRCLEQIRNDVGYHNQNVKIVAVGGGLAYGSLGYSHHGFEDLAVMSAMPNMTVLAPGDPVEARLSTEAIARTHGPCYLRLGKAKEAVVHQSPPRFEVGWAICLRDGVDVTLVSTGAMLPVTVQVADRLAAAGVSARVLSMHTIAPLDAQAIVDAADETGAIVTIEEHGAGGLGSMAGKVIAEAGIGIPFASMHLSTDAIKQVGSQEHLRACHGLSPEAIYERTVQVLARKSSGRRLLKAA